jgi:hypothetical protein
MNASANAFGTITGTYAACQVQFGVRLTSNTSGVGAPLGAPRDDRSV